MRARFDGQRFRVPSRVYSAPSIIYPGLDIELADLRGAFVRLGYREAGSDGSVQQGQYSWQEHRIRVHLRAFEHPTRSEPARDVVFRIRGGFIEEILELPVGRTLGDLQVLDLDRAQEDQAGLRGHTLESPERSSGLAPNLQARVSVDESDQEPPPRGMVPAQTRQGRSRYRKIQCYPNDRRDRALLRRCTGT